MRAVATCGTTAVSALSVTAGRGAEKPFCRAGRPTERDSRETAELGHIIDAVGGDMRGDIMYPPSLHPLVVAIVVQPSGLLSDSHRLMDDTTRAIARPQFFCSSPGGAILPPRPHVVRPSRAEAVEDAASRRRRLVLDGREHGGMLAGAVRSGGERWPAGRDGRIPVSSPKDKGGAAMSVRFLSVAVVVIVWATAASAQYARPVEPAPMRPVAPVVPPQVMAPMQKPMLTPSMPMAVPAAPKAMVPAPPPAAAPASRPRPRKCWCHQQAPNGTWMKSRCAPDCCRNDRNDERC